MGDNCVRWMVWVIKCAYWAIVQKCTCCPATPTLLRIRGAVPGKGHSLRLSDVELRDEVLLENSLFAALTLDVRWRKDSINSVGSLCSPRWASCRCLCVRSLEMTCDSGMPNTWGAVSAVTWGKTGDFRIHVRWLHINGEMMTFYLFHSLYVVFLVSVCYNNSRRT